MLLTSFFFFFFSRNCSVYSGTVAGAREAFFNGVPAVSVSYDWYVCMFDMVLLKVKFMTISLYINGC